MVVFGDSMFENDRSHMSIVTNSIGVAHSFKITVGLQEQNEGGVMHGLSEVVDIIENDLKNRVESGRLYLSGTVTAVTKIHAWGRVGMIKPPGVRVESAAVFSGEFDPSLTADGSTRVDVEFLLTEIALLLARRLGQVFVDIKCSDRVWKVSV